MRIFWKKGDELNIHGVKKSTGEKFRMLAVAEEDADNEVMRNVRVRTPDGVLRAVPASYVWMVKVKRGGGGE